MPLKISTYEMSAEAKTLEPEFVSLITDNQGIIHKVCNMYGDTEEDRRDLFQEVLLQLWRSYKNFRGEAKISTWMYRIALNTAISSFRKRKRSPEFTAISDYELQLPGAIQDSDQEERQKILHLAIRKLTKIERAIVMLHLEDHSYQEIAEITGITSNHVGVKLNRIKGKLKKILEPHFP